MAHRSQTKKHAQTHRSHKKITHATRKSIPWLWIGLGVAAVAILIVLLVVKPWQATSTSSITPAEAFEKYNAGVFFLDVREPAEWDAGRIPNTTLIPLGELSSRLGELPANQEIVVVCRSGNRSQEGRDILLKAGFTQVSSMDGGVRAWGNAGYPFEGAIP